MTLREAFRAASRPLHLHFFYLSCFFALWRVKGSEEMRESEGKNRCEHTLSLSVHVCVTFFLTGSCGLNHRRFHRHLNLSPLVEAAVMMVEVAGILALVRQLCVQYRQHVIDNNNTFSFQCKQTLNSSTSKHSGFIYSDQNRCSVDILRAH